MTKAELNSAVEARLAETQSALATLDDETALDVMVLFPEWAVGKDYATDERIRFGGKLYRCVQAHTSQVDWTPDLTPALWTEVAAPGEIAVWRQPTGAQDAYMKGDRVWFPERNTTKYESTVDENVWMPGVFGWVEI